MNNNTGITLVDVRNPWVWVITFERIEKPEKY